MRWDLSKIQNTQFAQGTVSKTTLGIVIVNVHTTKRLGKQEIQRFLRGAIQRNSLEKLKIIFSGKQTNLVELDDDILDEFKNFTFMKRMVLDNVLIKDSIEMVKRALNHIPEMLLCNDEVWDMEEQPEIYMSEALRTYCYAAKVLKKDKYRM